MTGDSSALPLNQIVQGDCIPVMAGLPPASVDLIFADPPYNLQLQQELHRPNHTRVDAVNDEWDKFADLAAYDAFTRAWLAECRRLLKPDGAIWVIGTYHNIYRVGAILMDLDYWILNEIIWEKVNPMPQFRGVRFTNAHETLIWAKASKDARSTFNYQAMKVLNEDKQMQSVWRIPLCTGAERLKINGRKAHSTQKPEALLYRVILASSQPGDVILDPFSGTGTTAAVAKKLGRHYVGIERDPDYVAVSRQRLAGVTPLTDDPALLTTESRRALPRVAFGQLVEVGYLRVGQALYSPKGEHCAVIRADSSLLAGEVSGSIHKLAARLQNVPTLNGWDYWHYEDGDGARVLIDTLRTRYRRDYRVE